MNMAKSEKAQCVRQVDAIVNASFRHIGLADEIEFRVGAALKTALHRRETDGLMSRHHFCLLVSCGKRNQKAGKQTDQRAGLQKERRLLCMFATQGVKRADGGDDKGDAE